MSIHLVAKLNTKPSKLPMLPLLSSSHFSFLFLFGLLLNEKPSPLNFFFLAYYLLISYFLLFLKIVQANNHFSVLADEISHCILYCCWFSTWCTTWSICLNRYWSISVRLIDLHCTHLPSRLLLQSVEAIRQRKQMRRNAAGRDCLKSKPSWSQPPWPTSASSPAQHSRLPV